MTRKNYCKMKDYTVYHTANPDLSGKDETSQINKSNIKHYEDAKYEIAEIHAITVIVSLKNKNNTIAAIYCPAGRAEKE